MFSPCSDRVSRMAPASATEKPAAMVVFFSSAIMVLTIGGTTERSACGSTTLPSIWRERQPERARRLRLADRHGVDARADDLADERRGVERQRHDRGGEEARTSTISSSG